MAGAGGYRITDTEPPLELLHSQAYSTRFLPSPTYTPMPSLSQEYDLAGRHVAVFGATGLVGSAVARRAAAAGARVTALGRDREKLDRLVDEPGSDARALVVDLRPGADVPFGDGERVYLALAPLGGDIPTADLIVPQPLNRAARPAPTVFR